MLMHSRKVSTLSILLVLLACLPLLSHGRSFNTIFRIDDVHFNSSPGPEPSWAAFDPAMSSASYRVGFPRSGSDKEWFPIPLNFTADFFGFSDVPLHLSPAGITVSNNATAASHHHGPGLFLCPDGSKASARVYVRHSVSGSMPLTVEFQCEHQESSSAIQVAIDNKGALVVRLIHANTTQQLSSVNSSLPLPFRLQLIDASGGQLPPPAVAHENASIKYQLQEECEDCWIGTTSSNTNCTRCLSLARAQSCAPTTVIDALCPTRWQVLPSDGDTLSISPLVELGHSVGTRRIDNERWLISDPFSVIPTTRFRLFQSDLAHPRLQTQQTALELHSFTIANDSLVMFGDDASVVVKFALVRTANVVNITTIANDGKDVVFGVEVNFQSSQGDPWVLSVTVDWHLTMRIAFTSSVTGDWVSTDLFNEMILLDGVFVEVSPDNSDIGSVGLSGAFLAMLGHNWTISVTSRYRCSAACKTEGGVCLLNRSCVATPKEGGGVQPTEKSKSHPPIVYASIGVSVGGVAIVIVVLLCIPLKETLKRRNRRRNKKSHSTHHKSPPIPPAGMPGDGDENGELETSQLRAFDGNEGDDRREGGVDEEMREIGEQQTSKNTNGRKNRERAASGASRASASTPPTPVAPLASSPTINFVRGQLIGAGGFGRVYRGFDKTTGQVLAAKELAIDSLGPKMTELKLRYLRREIRVMRELDHPNLVKYYGVNRGRQCFYILMEYVGGGSIRDLLEARGQGLPSPLAGELTRQLLLGLQHMHGRGVIHRDLKCSNILLTPQYIVKIADFGASRHLDTVSGVSGTPHWIAPEVIRSEQVTSHSDVWSVGCTALEMLTGKTPFIDQHRRYQSLWHELSLESTTPPIPDSVADEARDFIAACLKQVPAERPPVGDLLQHPFVRERVTALDDFAPRAPSSASSTANAEELQSSTAPSESATSASQQNGDSK